MVTETSTATFVSRSGVYSDDAKVEHWDLSIFDDSLGLACKVYRWDMGMWWELKVDKMEFKDNKGNSYPAVYKDGWWRARVPEEKVLPDSEFWPSELVEGSGQYVHSCDVKKRAVPSHWPWPEPEIEEEPEGVVTVFGVLGDEDDRPIEEVKAELKRLVEGATKEPLGDGAEAAKQDIGKDQIMMMNGIFDLDTHTFDDTGFNPDEYHIAAIPIIYDSEAECPNIKQFFREVLIKKDENGEIPKDGDDKNIKAIIEFFGYCLYKSYPHAIVLMLLGEGANGKSTLLDLLRGFLGSENCVACTPQQLATNRWAKAHFLDKLANIVDDIPAESFQYTGEIKMMIGGDLIQAEYMSQPPFSFVNHAKMIFSANKLPRTYDTTSAFHRRMRIIDLPNVFSSADPNTKPRDELVASLTTPEELSGLFLLAVGGLRRLRESGKLTGDEDDRPIAGIESEPVIELRGKVLNTGIIMAKPTEQPSGPKLELQPPEPPKPKKRSRKKKGYACPVCGIRTTKGGKIFASPRSVVIHARMAHEEKLKEADIKKG